MERGSGFSRCPGCDLLVGGSVVRRGSQLWHRDCWGKNLESCLEAIAGYWSAGDLGDPADQEMVRSMVKDALAGEKRWQAFYTGDPGRP